MLPDEDYMGNEEQMKSDALLGYHGAYVVEEGRL